MGKAFRKPMKQYQIGIVRAKMILMKLLKGSDELKINLEGKISKANDLLDMGVSERTWYWDIDF